MTMKTSPQGVALIEEREGTRLTAYQDSVGVWTIGVGHTAGVCEGMTITPEESRALLAEDLQWAEAAVNGYVKVALEQYQFDALGSFVINVGQSQFRHSTMLTLINGGRFDLVPAQFDRWHIPVDVTTRRNAEREQFKGTQFVARCA